MNNMARHSCIVDMGQLEAAMRVGGLAWWAMDCRSGAMQFHRHKVDMLGYEPEGFEHYTDFTSLLHPDDLQLATQAMQDLLADRLPEYRVDCRLRAKSGEYRWFQDVGRVSQRDEAGRPATLTGIVLDISERKRVEENLREREERLRKLFHGHSAIMLIIDPETGRINDANESAARFYGWSVEELRQMRIQQINDLSPEEVGKRMAIARSERNARFEFRHRRADGSIMDVEVFSNKVEIEGTVLLYSIIHDIGERKHAERLVRKTHDRLRHAEEFARFGHWELSLGDRTIHASDGALGIYGFAENEVPLSSIQRCALEEYRPLLDAALKALIEDDKPYDVTFEIRRASDGAVVAVHSRAEYDAINRRVFGVVQDITEQKAIQTERENLILQLQNALEQIRTLRGIVPICSSCKKIRDDAGYWQQVEAYLTRHTEARFSHGICPDCRERLYPGM